MNSVILTGKVYGDIDINMSKEPTECRFKLKSSHYVASTGKIIQSTIFCRATGSLADYCYNELWDGANIMVTGCLRNVGIKATGTVINHTFVYCNIVTKIEQGEYN